MTLLIYAILIIILVAYSSFYILNRRLGLWKSLFISLAALFIGILSITFLYKSGLSKMVYRALSVMKPKVAIAKFWQSELKEQHVYNGISVSILAKKNNEASTAKSIISEFDDDIQLYALINDNGKLYSDAPDMLKSKKALALKNYPSEISFAWYKLEPEYKYYIHKNEYSRFNKAFCEKMKMGEMKFFQKYFKKGTQISLDQKSNTNRSLYWKGKAVGTMRYKVVAKLAGQKISSKGINSLNSGQFKKMNEVMRVSVKADSGNKVLDRAFAYGNLPYYWGSNNFNYAWYGSDCAKYTSVVYKDVGNSMGYIGTAQLNGRKAKAVINAKNKKGQPTAKDKVLRFNANVNEGDIILMRNSRRGHAGFIGEDSNNNGILDGEDMVLHTSFSAPKYEKLKDTHFILDRVIRDYDVKIIAD